jgi:glycogen debranching enzyme
MALVMLCAVAPAIQAQNFTSVAGFPFDQAGPVIQAHAEPSRPFTVAGERGVLLGQQDGTFEAWVLPVKLLSHLRIEATVEGIPVPEGIPIPINMNLQAAEVEVRPDRTVITYSDPAFTVRQIMFSPDEASTGTGPIVLFEFECLHPTDFSFRFTPELRWMWPEDDSAVPSAEWVGDTGTAGGFYMLHTKAPNLAGAITIPGAQPGVLAPQQEHPAIYPLELKLHVDPVRDRGRLFPLLMAVGTTEGAAATPALSASLAKLNDGIAASYKAHAERYRKLLANATTIETPDKTLNEAFQWAVVSIEQLRTKVQHTDETALVAGYYNSADSARPGFGWFFGRDSLYTLYAINGYGDFALSKSELEFLIHRQSADGKIMHEYSQTAADVDWQSLPYMYAAADSTPLFLLAMEDYVRASGDTAFLTANRDAIEKGWAFETDPAHDTDHDGIYDNSQGTGWVESWPGGMPHQEIYLALLDEQASGAMAELEKLLGNPEKSAAAQERFDTVAKTIETEYYDPEKSCYAFSHNADGTQDRTSTVYPAMAWWSELGNKPVLAHKEGCLQQFAVHTLATDWGLRDVSTDEKIYDGMSYHQGSVWPLFTGWAALAEYRGGQPLAGYQMLMENASLTRFEDLGADTELLSGDFYVPFGRSTSHQLWSSAMVITPTLRGLFGISIDAQTKTITVNPHLPANWDRAEVRELQIPNGSVSLSFSRNGEILEVCPDMRSIDGWHLRSDISGATPGTLVNDKSPVKVGVVPCKGLRIPVRAVEIEPPAIEPPSPGDRTYATRVLNEQWGANQVKLTFEGQADSRAMFGIHCRREIARLRISSPENMGTDAQGEIRLGAQLSDPAVRYSPDTLKVDAPKGTALLWLRFPPGEGWKTITVTLTW